jgi:hypothetical protein
MIAITHPYVLLHELSLPTRLLPTVEKGERGKGDFWGLGWTPSKVMQAHLQNLVSQGFMMAVELATYHVPKDATSPQRRRDTWWPLRCFTIMDSVC